MAGFLKDSFTKSNSVGMDEAQMKKDRSGYSTTTQMVTGGTFEDGLADIGAEVGNPYDEDMLGEEYEAVTYENYSPKDKA
jgi:hypothetical protein